ncbi:MAG: peptide chain release factor aRF-1 [Candidatus Pacearchaeota archaeon]|jgi:peptide chain release factor subunit 1
MPKLNKNELEDTLEELKIYRGRHTELISVYVSEGYDINAVQRQLEAEKSTAKNIKSTATRKNVIEALEKIVRHLKTLKRTPENGLALFSGNISDIEGQDDIRLWEIEPPEPVKIRLYRCDKEFVLDPLEAMLEIDEIYALLVMDRKEATIGQLVGKRIELLQKMTSGIPSKVRAGGQSSQRFHRITEGLTKEFYKRISDEMKKIFYENPKLKGIIVGGPIPTKDEFLDNEYLPTQLAKKVLGRVDIGDTSESGLKELVEKSRELLVNQEIIAEKKLLERFFETLGARPGMALYKIPDIEKALEMGAVDLMIISKDFDRKTAKEFKVKAENIGSKVEIVSTETEEGQQFYNLSGLGVLMRFRIS